MHITRENHYVPIWYQKGFVLPKQTDLSILDLNFDEYITLSCGKRIKKKTSNNPKKGRPGSIGVQRDLYTTFPYGALNDEIEKILFGNIDRIGAKATRFFSSMLDTNGSDIPTSLEKNMEIGQAWSNLLEYIDAQKIRTPKALDLLRRLIFKKEKQECNQNQMMLVMQKIRQFYQVTLGEGLWEIVKATDASTKFIFSDDPVTIYNCDYFSGSKQCQYPYDPHPYELGSRIIFPLDINNCLIISNIEFAKNPERCFARKIRRNARSYDDVTLDVRDIKKDRNLNNEEVCFINYIIKKRAPRYIAAAREEWLFPEKNIEIPQWPKLDYVLRHQGFSKKLNTIETIISYKNGTKEFITPFGEKTIIPEWFNRGK